MNVPADRIDPGLLLIEDTPASPRRAVPAPHSKNAYRVTPAPRGQAERKVPHASHR